MGLSGGRGFGCAACRHQSGRTRQAFDLAPEPGTYLPVEPVLLTAFAVAVVRFAGKAPVKSQRTAIKSPSICDRRTTPFSTAAIGPWSCAKKRETTVTTSPI